MRKYNCAQFTTKGGFGCGHAFISKRNMQSNAFGDNNTNYNCDSHDDT